MERFLTQHNGRISGIVAGFDRILFKGTLRSISYRDGMDRFLSSQRVLYKHYDVFVERVTGRVKAHAKALADRNGRPYEYLESATISKGDRAREIQMRDGVTHGLVCVFGCVEGCLTFTVCKNRKEKRLELVAQNRRCLHLYFYFVDPEWGLIHVRLQTWFPLTIEVCVNGRERLAHDLERAGIAYTRVDNVLTAVGDFPRAQMLADQLATTFRWKPFLSRYAEIVNPWLTGTDPMFLDYYWTVREMEYATDVVFTDSDSLATLYPRLLHHAIEHFDTSSVLRFLGRQVPGRFAGESHATLARRPEGIRVRHWVDRNSIKMYDKAGCVIRVETTINNQEWFKVRRRNSRRKLAWMPLRKGVADLRRQAEISAGANARYLDALAVVGDPTPSRAILDPVSSPVVFRARRYRPLRPITPDESSLFAVLLRGETAIQGVRNRDIRKALAPDATDPHARRRASGRATRQIRLLRAHGLIRKVSATRYYRVTPKGHRVMTTALRFRETDIALLAE